MYLSLYCKGSKRVTQGLRVRGSWRPNKDCYILTPTLMVVSVVSFSFSWCSTRGPGARLSAEWWLSLLHLITNWSLKLLGAPSAPSAGSGFPYHILSATSLDPNCLTSCHHSSTPTQSPTQSLEWHVWSSSSGNNCHAVQRSLSSGASVYECIMGFFTLSHLVSLRDFFWLLVIGMCHSLPMHHFEMAYLAGLKVKIQHLQRCSQCILQPQPTGQMHFSVISKTLLFDR